LLEDLLEDLKKLGLLDLSVSRLVNCLDESLNLLLGDLGIGSHVIQGGRDEGEDFVGVQAVAVVLVELGEDGIDGISELLVSVGHDLWN
jgi:hypothetical protein